MPIASRYTGAVPTYEYRCASGHETEVFAKMSDPPLRKCPECGGTNLSRVMSAFARRRTSLQRLEDVDHVREAARLQGNDPGAFAEWAKRAGREWDEELGTNWGELSERVEAGEDPAERIDADYTFRYQIEEQKYQIESGGQPAFDDPYAEYFNRPVSEPPAT